MRLGTFIESHLESIQLEWEAFAEGIAPSPTMTTLALRDHASDILLAIVRDMACVQTDDQQAEKSKGHRPLRDGSAALNHASEIHAIGRLGVGFDLAQVVSEYRALRASVLRLWHESDPAPDDRDLEDVTRFNEAMDQLVTKSVVSFTKKVDQARDMFLAILSHDPRNPLHSISMSAQVLPILTTNAAQTQKYARQITANVTLMSKMISDLLDYTRTRLGTGMPVTPIPMDLRTLTAGLADEFSTAHPHRALRYRAAGDTRGSWDVDRLRQAISNLLGNAMQHGSHEAPVDLTLDCTGADGVEIAVHNGGPPIAAGDLPRIFDPLIRGSDADGPKVNRPGSIGLGLYIAREVAKSHGGRIDVTSTAANGTTFTIRLPRHAPARTAGPVMNEAQIQAM